MLFGQGHYTERDKDGNEISRELRAASHHVYIIHVNGAGKVDSVVKVWNDAFAANPGLRDLPHPTNPECSITANGLVCP